MVNACIGILRQMGWNEAGWGWEEGWGGGSGLRERRKC